MRTAEEWVAHFTFLVKDNLDKSHMNNPDWAKMLNLSDRQFYRQVVNLTGKSPNVFTREIRIEAAFEFLESGKYKTVKEIAYLVGFKNASYFSQLYEESKGVTPGEVLRTMY